MISFRYLTLSAIVMAFLSFVMLFAGCESSKHNDLAISPDSITVNSSSATKIIFTATGGEEPFTWSVSSSIGAIAGAGTSAVYTAYATVGLNVVTVTDANSNSVSAHVTQGQETAGNGLAITPDYMAVSGSATNVITFTASGGVEPYRWTISNPALGVLSGIGNGAVYTTYALTGENSVTVTDFNSNSVSATIAQE